MVNGEPVDNQSSPVGTLFEGYNMLTGAFRCWFTSIGQRVTYKLPTDKLTDNSGEDILIEYLDNGGLTHTWTIPYDSSKSLLPTNRSGRNNYMHMLTGRTGRYILWVEQIFCLYRNLKRATTLKSQRGKRIVTRMS